MFHVSSVCIIFDDNNNNPLDLIYKCQRLSTWHNSKSSRELHRPDNWSSHPGYWALVAGCEDINIEEEERSSALPTPNAFGLLLLANETTKWTRHVHSLFGQCQRYIHDGRRLRLSYNLDETLYRANFWKTCKPTSSWCLLGNGNRLADISRTRALAVMVLLVEHRGCSLVKQLSLVHSTPITRWCCTPNLK